MLISDDLRWAWIKASAALGLILFLPFVLLATPLAVVARIWWVVLLLSAFGFFVVVFIGAAAGAAQPALLWLEGHIRAWVARFARDPEALWLHWARRSHYPVLGRSCLDRAVALGGREAIFQEALVFLEGGMGTGGHTAGVERLRRAALRGHPEAAFRLAEALRTGHGSLLADPVEAELWYRRAVTLGYGPAAAWLAHAHQVGDGVEPDEAKAAEWGRVAATLQPFPEPSHSLLRHDAGPGDRLVGWTAQARHGLETTADQLVAHQSGRWLVMAVAGFLALLAILSVGFIFWVGSSGLHHLPLFMLLPLVLMLVWQARMLRKGGPKRGRDRLLVDAEAGDPEACYQLGLAYRRGSAHRPKDDLSATLWFRKAADAGHEGAIAAMAEAYLGGHGVVRDPREAARWKARLEEAAPPESTS